MDEGALQNLNDVSGALRGGVLTIGNFDGVHRGHQLILHVARELANARGLNLVAMTFDPPPDLVLRPGDAPKRLTPHEAKCRLLREHGADAVVTVRPEPGLLALSPDEFIRQALLDRFAPRHIVEGDDFRFGRNRAGDVRALRQAGGSAGFEVHVVEPVVQDLPEGAARVSSSLIRRLVGEGRIEEANRCLGRPFTLVGPVVAGQGRGRLLEFPTANLDPGEQVCPPDGVYAGRADVDGGRYPAAVSIGNKPTFGPAEETSVEAFLLDAEGDFYDEKMELAFLRRLRDQRRFASPGELREQIVRDVAQVRRIHGGAFRHSG